MKKLLTGYVVNFNRRHRRAGHLFQNRYKSIVVEEEPYVLELTRYIHLNPLRAGLVPGLTGLAILDAILAGERDPQALAQHRHPRIKASPETIAKALVGDYRPEHLFTLRQSLAAYRHTQALLADCDREVQTLLGRFASTIEPAQHPLPATPKARRTLRGRSFLPGFDLRTELYRILGTDLTRVPGLQTPSVFTLFAELGADLSAFPAGPQFTSWLGLCPDNRISGGKVLSVQTRHVKHRVADALRIAAQSLSHSRSILGDYFRRMRAKLGPPKAITATAHKLARIIYSPAHHR